MSVALVLVFRAMTQKSDVPASGEAFDQAKRELLTVVLDRRAACVNGSVQSQLGAILAGKLGPGDAPRLACLQKTFARTEGRHPHVVSGVAHPTWAKARSQDAESIGLAINRRPNRFGFE